MIKILWTSCKLQAIVGLLVMLFFGCVQKKRTKPEPRQQEIVQYDFKVLIAKHIDYRIEHDGYYLAFDDGHYEAVNFGVFSCHQVGDTIMFEVCDDCLMKFKMFQ